MTDNSLPIFGAGEPPKPGTISGTSSSGGGANSMPPNVPPATPVGAAAPPKPDARNVRIASLGDANTPIVMMFGPANSGKTVALLRLAKFFSDKYGEVIADKAFRDDEYYKQVLCGEFQTFLTQVRPNRPINTPDADFAAVDFLERGTTAGRMCKFVEVPGEHLFNPRRPDSDQTTHPYLFEICSHPARKIILITIPLVDPRNNAAGALTDPEFLRYCAVIQRFFVNSLNPKRDQLIFVITKADEQTGMIANSVQPNVTAFRKALMSRPGFAAVESTLRRQGHGVVVVPFSAGKVVAAAPASPDAFIFGDDAWPQRLWDELSGAIRGTGLIASVKSLFRN